MKAILKNIKKEDDLDYEDTFNSKGNLKICSRLIPEFIKAMGPKYRPSVFQITKWLGSLHKSRRSQAKLKSSGKITEDNCRIHSNSRVNEICNSCNSLNN